MVLAGGVTLIVAWAGIRRGIGALNDRHWDREWARVGPEWTGHGGDHRRDAAAPVERLTTGRTSARWRAPAPSHCPVAVVRPDTATGG